ncbi:MAG: NUDIX domain-containing protein [Anaerolineae bacterium]|nr:NUDIX domain-containing protein [Anaerolineae bacterium]MDK1119447.1 NUDIX domain-containing protein [Anaerolineae bacterium]
MRVRAGVVLINDRKVSLIERHRNGRHYFVFPGGGVDRGESMQEAAIREMEEETGLRVTIVRKLAEIHSARSFHIYYLVERVSGKYGTGTGEEYTEADPDNPNEGVYTPIWMPIKELLGHKNVFPADIADLVRHSIKAGWPADPIVGIENLN